MYDISSFMSRFWRLPGTGLRFCAHSGGVQGQDGCAVLGWDRVVLGWDRAVFLDFAGTFGNIYQATL